MPVRSATSRNHHETPIAATASIQPAVPASARHGRPARIPASTGTTASGSAISFTRNASAKAAPARIARPTPPRRTASRPTTRNRSASAAAGRSRRDGRPDAPAQESCEQHQPDSGDRVQEVPGVQWVDPEPPLREHEEDGPDRRMEQEEIAERRPRPEPVEDVVADPDVLRLVERDEEGRRGQQERTEDDG